MEWPAAPRTGYRIAHGGLSRAFYSLLNGLDGCFLIRRIARTGARARVTVDK